LGQETQPQPEQNPIHLTTSSFPVPLFHRLRHLQIPAVSGEPSRRRPPPQHHLLLLSRRPSPSISESLRPTRNPIRIGSTLSPAALPAGMSPPAPPRRPHHGPLLPFSSWRGSCSTASARALHLSPAATQPATAPRLPHRSSSTAAPHPQEPGRPSHSPPGNGEGR
jgi:hypothetical protein